MRLFTPVVIGLALVTALGLSIASYVGWCSESCTVVHNYRLFGLTFETVGIAFFSVALILLALSFHRTLIFLLCAGVGAELVFLFIQKHVIGSWCPVCVSIAICVGIATLTACLMWSHLRDGRLFLAMAAAALTASFALSEVQPAQQEALGFEQAIAFGKLDSEIEIFLFTDWGCKACHSLEPALGTIIASATPNAKVTFVDHVIHPETLNYMPYNLSFMVHNKAEYIAIRGVLTHLAEVNKSPTETDIETAVASMGVSYRELNYADVAVGMRYFQQLGQRFHVMGTPTMVIHNRTTDRSKQLSGPVEINVDNLRKAIEEVRAP